MHNRIIAFFISSNEKSQPSYEKASSHFRRLGESFSRQELYLKLEKYHLHLIYEGEIDKLLQKDGSCIKFCVGPHTGRKNSGWLFSFEKRSKIRDRFLNISIDKNEISISNDFIGAIPVYYSLRKKLSISNIEPVVVLDSDSTYGDLYPEAVYSLFHYTHFIDTETFYRHIKSQEPDSTYVYTTESRKPLVKYHNSVYASEERIGMKSKDIIDEFTELNRKLVMEAIGDEEDIILSLSSGYDSRMILAAALENKEVKSRLRTYTHSPNMSIETRAVEELVRIAGLEWEKVDIRSGGFNLKRLEQAGMIYGSGLHFHGKYKLDFMDQVMHSFIPGKSIITEGFVTGTGTGSSSLCGLDIKGNAVVLTELMDSLGTSRFTSDEYLFAHSKVFKPEMKDYTAANLQKIFNRFEGAPKQKIIMLDIWARQHNFFSYQPRIIEWEIPNISPHVAPEFFNFSFSLPLKMLKKHKMAEMMLARYYKKINRVSTNSNLTVKSIMKRSIARPTEGMFYYAPLLIKYFFKQPWLLPEKMLEEMKDPTVPDLREVGKAGVAPIYELNKQSREIFNEYFELAEVDRLLAKAVAGDELSSKRLSVVQTLAYGLKLMEK
jgi:hypothetical protein